MVVPVSYALIALHDLDTTELSFPITPVPAS
jgi:hypothetical protein